MNLRNQHVLSSYDGWHKSAQSKITLIPKITNKLPRLPINDWKRFNEIIGNPLHPATLKPSPILPHQFEYRALVHEFHKVLFNKSRKIGATDAALRIICERCYNEYMGHNVMIVAGNRQSQANDFLNRFDDLFWGYNDRGWTDLNNKVWKHDDLVIQKSSSQMELFSGVKITTYPAIPTALRGPENVKCVFVSEAAHINRLEDHRTYTSLSPIGANDPEVDEIYETTPNGRRGFFYKLWSEAKKQTSKSKFKMLEKDYNCALGTLITQEFIDTEKNNPEIDFQQEYCCKFTSTNTSAIDIDAIIYREERVSDFSEILDKDE